jgi:hypothetical protein
LSPSGGGRGRISVLPINYLPPPIPKGDKFKTYVRSYSSFIVD